MGVRRTDGAVRQTKGRRQAGTDRLQSRKSDVAPPAGQQIWRGASGTLYVHAVTSLLFCPEMPKATYLLVHRDAEGMARVLRVGCLENVAQSLNLAQIRQVGAALGANEVHIRPDAGSAAERARIAFDIEHGLAVAGQIAISDGKPGDRPISA